LKTVISASRRTDIPAFYLDWFIEQIKRGYAVTANPFYPQQRKKISLHPDEVEWIVFWSRNYQIMLNKKKDFSNYNLFFIFTILPKSDLEKSGIPLLSALEQLEQLSEHYGPERINWRYDPLIYWQEDNKIETNHTIEKFEYLCQRISSFKINRCYFSFAHPYKKFIDRMRLKFPNRKLIRLNTQKEREIISKMVDISEKYDIRLYSCSNDALLTIPKVKKGHCIDGELLNKLTGKKIVSEAKQPSRANCGCTKSVDIGSYTEHPCHFGCIYCYANPLWR
jgi:hypothetical protein